MPATTPAPVASERPAPEWYWRKAYKEAPTADRAALIFDAAIDELEHVRAAYRAATGQPAPRHKATRLECEAHPEILKPVGLAPPGAQAVA